MLLVTRKVAGGRPAKNIWVVDASGDVVQVAGTHLLESIWRSTNFMVMLGRGQSLMILQ